MPSGHESPATRAGASSADPETAPRDSVVGDANHAVEAATAGRGTPTRPTADTASRIKKQYRVLTFDGLRSHAKEK